MRGKSDLFQRILDIDQPCQGVLGLAQGFGVLGVGNVVFSVLDLLVQVLDLQVLDRDCLFCQNGQTTGSHVGKTAANEIFVQACALFAAHLQNAGLNGGHEGAMILQNTEFTFGTGNDYFENLFGQELALRRDQLELE